MQTELVEKDDVKLTPRQEQFIQEYLIDLNATQAYIRAGYAVTGAGESAHDLLKRPEVARRIAMAKAQRVTRTRFSQDQVLHEMSLLAHSRIDWFRIDDAGQVELTERAPVGAMGCIQAIKRRVTHKSNPQTGEQSTTYDVEIKLWDKPTPLKLMGRHVGLFPDRVELTGPNGGPIPIARIESVVVDPKQVGQGSTALALTQGATTSGDA